ncbi:hypothetical protein MX111_10985 [Streptococcus uberis]|uniref:hypothetical protein n=1 Tax=Streptococcus uberis TaxID=1349 RepID=UPI0027DADD96|nr:hypothetical protein [Streptococcus uberis]MCK1239871.1 hypothetical protein [Streptococcus uberis]
MEDRKKRYIKKLCRNIRDIDNKIESLLHEKHELELEVNRLRKSDDLPSEAQTSIFDFI